MPFLAQRARMVKFVAAVVCVRSVRTSLLPNVPVKPDSWVHLAAMSAQLLGAKPVVAKVSATSMLKTVPPSANVTKTMPEPPVARLVLRMITAPFVMATASVLSRTIRLSVPVTLVSRATTVSLVCVPPRTLCLILKPPAACVSLGTLVAARALDRQERRLMSSPSLFKLQ